MAYFLGASLQAGLFMAFESPVSDSVAVRIGFNPFLKFALCAVLLFPVGPAVCLCCVSVYFTFGFA